MRVTSLLKWLVAPSLMKELSGAQLPSAFCCLTSHSWVRSITRRSMVCTRAMSKNSSIPYAVRILLAGALPNHEKPPPGTSNDNSRW